MKSSILAFLGFASAAFAHGIVTDICIDGHFYDLYDPAKTPNIHPKPEIPGWTVPGPVPVTDVKSAAIACNDGSKNGTIYATAYAGAEVTFFWTKWPANHQGSVMTYLAGVSSEDPTELDFFKINHSGLYPDGTWATDKLSANNNSYSVHIPKDLLAGHYVLRHEILALQEANVTAGAQFYPVCINLEISGYGAAVPTDTVKFPGAYKPDDSDILIDIYHPHPITSYKIPGPAPYVEGSIPYTGALPSPTPDTHGLKPEFKYPPSSSSSSSSSSSYAPSAGYYVYSNSSMVPTYSVPSTHPESTTTLITVVTDIKTVTRTHKRHSSYPTSSSTSPCKKKTTTSPPPSVYPEATPTVKDKDTSPPPPVVYVTTTVHKTVTVTNYKKKHVKTETKTKTKTKTETETKIVTVTKTPVCSPAGRYNANF